VGYDYVPPRGPTIPLDTHGSGPVLISAHNQMKQRRRRPAQLSLATRGAGRGGWRAGAGRKPKPAHERRGHRSRPELPARFPVHLTLKVLPEVANLRRGHCYAVLRRCFARGKDRFGFRLIHFAVQSNHLHLIGEAGDRTALSRGMQGLAIRIARGLNRKLGRRGPLRRALPRARPAISDGDSAGAGLRVPTESAPCGRPGPRLGG